MRRQALSAIHFHDRLGFIIDFSTMWIFTQSLIFTQILPHHEISMSEKPLAIRCICQFFFFFF